MSDIEKLLAENRDADLLRLSTAGSVDDGKSTLIGRLLNDSKNIYEDQLAAVHKDSAKLNREEVDLALLMDGLKAEREQGITIDVAYRYFSTPRRRFIIADTPGHEQYTRNMATGASTANLAIILIDARNGVLTQSKRHAFIASLLGIPHIVVAVNKMDLVDYSQAVFAEIRRTYDAFTSKLNVRDLIYIPISALRGDNVVERSANMSWYTGPPLLYHLETVHIGSDRNLIDLRFPVQYVNRPNLDFRGYCGAVASGVVRVGDEVVALPSGKSSRVKSIVTFDGELSYAFPPLSVTLCLEDEIDISRGDMLVHASNHPRLERELDAMLVWMAEEPLRVGKPYVIKHTTNQVRGAVTKLHYRVDPNELHREDVAALGLNEIGRATLELYRPLMCDAYTANRATGSFVVIDPLTNATVAAGTVIERSAYRHRSGGADAEPLSGNLSTESHLIGAEARRQLLGQAPATVWFTGLSASGKSTLAKNLEKCLIEQGCACYLLDGDNLRRGLNRDLGFGADDRTENIRRIAEVARLFNEAGLIVVTAFISPYSRDRRDAREIIGEEHFIEVFTDAPLAVCEQRDPKGLYGKARRGEIARFTGISAPYEPPSLPALTLHTDALTVAAGVERVIALLRERGIIG